MRDTIGTIGAEEGLDPQDWDAMRRRGHSVVDDLVSSTLQHVRERPAWRTVPDGSRASLSRPLPLEPRDPAAVNEDVRQHVLPYLLVRAKLRAAGAVRDACVPRGA